jgi:hypothetical protein
MRQRNIQTHKRGLSRGFRIRKDFLDTSDAEGAGWPRRFKPEQGAADNLDARWAVDEAGTESSGTGKMGTESPNDNGPARQRLVRNACRVRT